MTEILTGIAGFVGGFAAGVLFVLGAMYKFWPDMTDTKIVSCKECFVRTIPVSIDHPNFTANGLDESTRYTPEQAAQKACEMWNRRANDADRKDC